MSDNYSPPPQNRSNAAQNTLSVEKKPDGRIIVYPLNYFNFHTSFEFKEQVINHFDNCTGITIDFSFTTHIDSSGIGILISLHHALPDNIGKVHLTNLSPHIRRIINIHNLHIFFIMDP